MRRVGGVEGATKPAYPPGLVGRTAARLKRIADNITIEPAMFLISFASSIDNVAISQMNIYKSCRVDFGYNDTICLNLIPDYPDENEEIQEVIAQFNVYQIMVDSVFPVFFSFYLGAWADMFGRKLLFYIYLAAKILSHVGVILCAHFLVSPKEWILLATIPTALSGGFAAFILAINAFIADITQPENRAFRYGMLHLASSLGRPLAAPVGAYLLKTGGYVCVITASLSGVVVGAILLVIRIQQYKWTPKKKDKDQRKAMSLLHIKDCFRALFKKREGPNRKYIFVFFLITIFTIMPFFGEFSIAYNYVRTRYQWEVDEYSTYSSITSASSIVAQAIIIPLVSMLRVNEAWIMTLVSVSITARHTIKALASEPWLYYLGALVDIIGSYSLSITKSMCSTCVPPEELGKIYAVLSAFENLLPIGVSQAYASLWAVTDSVYPGAVFFVSAGLSLISLSLAIYIQISLRGRKISELTAAGAGRKTEQELQEERANEQAKGKESAAELFDNMVSSTTYL